MLSPVEYAEAPGDLCLKVRRCPRQALFICPGSEMLFARTVGALQGASQRPIRAHLQDMECGNWLDNDIWSEEEAAFGHDRAGPAGGHRDSRADPSKASHRCSKAVDQLGQPAVIFTHDAPGASFTDRLVLLDDGRVIHDGGAVSPQQALDLMKGIGQ